MRRRYTSVEERESLPDSRVGREGCAVVFALACIISVAMGLMSLRRLRTLQLNCVNAKAAIVSRTGSRRTAYEYEFVVNDQKFRGHWEASESDRSYDVGEVIPVSYHQHEPAQNNYGNTLASKFQFESPTGWLVAAAISACLFFAQWRAAPAAPKDYPWD